MKELLVPISIGELVDKLTILEIKKDKLDSQKVKNVANEFKILSSILKKSNINVDNKLKNKLKEINKKLWEIEDLIRLKEKDNIFDDEFISLARSVYKSNDERSKIKKEINLIYKSFIIEEKSYK